MFSWDPFTLLPLHAEMISITPTVIAMTFFATNNEASKLKSKNRTSLNTRNAVFTNNNWHTLETIRTLETSRVLLWTDELLEPAVSEGIFRQACNSHSENAGKNKLVDPKISMEVFVVWFRVKKIFLSGSKICSNSTVSKRSKTRHHSTFNSGLTAYSIVSNNRNTPDGKHKMTLRNLGPKDDEGSISSTNVRKIHTYWKIDGTTYRSHVNILWYPVISRLSVINVVEVQSNSSCSVDCTGSS